MVAGDEVSLDGGKTFHTIERVASYVIVGQNRIRIYIKGSGTTFDDSFLLLKRERPQ